MPSTEAFSSSQEINITFNTIKNITVKIHKNRRSSSCAFSKAPLIRQILSVILGIWGCLRREQLKLLSKLAHTRLLTKSSGKLNLLIENLPIPFVCHRTVRQVTTIEL